MYTQSRGRAAWRGLIIGLTLVLTGAAFAASEDISFVVEEPKNDDTYSGVANIRGWAVSPLGMSHVELYVDGVFNTNIPLGGRRADVESEFPNIPDAGESGFSMAFNYSELTQGAHTLSIRAVESTGASRETTVNFEVARLDNPYVQDESSVNLDGAICTISGDRVLLDNVSVEGKTYDLDLGWRAESQDFAVEAIAESAERAQWRADAAACCTNGNFIVAVTIDGLTQSASVASCSSEPVVEGFVGVPAGSQSVSASAAGLCGSANFSGNFTFAAGTCYSLQVEFNTSAGQLKLVQTEVDCED
ncbi:MAG: hypothetical protein H6970_01150 [Gammaproteobacteria bacterium]|nr:hypothetical protein [Gammaproteobacteria bacterium]MCP5423664.1 hypothetical protein [Gammaproteobacteria bacterium]